jgi:S-adenosylmethionine-diacylgycerolhomoserine-N-methlytransferase
MSMNRTAATPSSAALGQSSGIESYYRMHAQIYDATRWSFLFGREAVVRLAASAHPAPARILEVGCGTGRNLAALARRFPQAQITGLDLSDAMLAIARKKTAGFGDRVNFRRRAYDSPIESTGAFDLVLCSYALSMFNPGFEAAIAAAGRDLAPGGHFALVDFHATRFPWFARWMGVNHVRMDGQLRPLLRSTFTPVVDRLESAYGGVWQYLMFVGRRAT